MRGDSLRDLYAKTLAVVGLGLLAGAGAVVDYWPVSEQWPAAPVVAGLGPSAPVLVQDLTREIPAPRIVRAANLPRPADLAIDTELLNGVPPAGASASIVVLDPMPIPDDFLRVDRGLPAAWLAASVDLDPAPIVESESGDSHRLFGGAIRRTRKSLSAARVFLGDALSGVMGAFRRVSPFFSAAAVAPTSF